MQQLDRMVAFVQVMEARSFSVAARRLRLSKSVVSRRVTALENQLGVRLLNRTTRTLSPTEAGRAYADRCAAILADIENAEERLRSLGADISGVLRVAAPMSFGVQHLAPAVAAFMAANPRLRVEIDVSDRFVDLVSEGFDMAIRIGRLKDSTLVARRLAPARRIACCSPAYAARRGVPARPQDLSAHDCLLYTNLAAGEQWRFRVGQRWRSIAVQGPLRINNGEMLVEAAKRGLGIVVLPTFICADAIRSGALMRILPQFESLDATVYAVYPHNRHVSAKVRKFVDFLAAHFAPGPSWDEGIA
jgi:DNA-binding transcriptional LysR family regulator